MVEICNDRVAVFPHLCMEVKKKYNKPKWIDK